MNDFIVTYGIIAITVITSILAFQKASFYERSLFSAYYILKKHEFHRAITSAFIHADMGHLIFNMISFYAFSLGLEAVYGHPVIVAVYLASAIAGSLLSLLLHRKDSDYRAVGASGAVCGIIFASIFLLPGGSIIVFPLPIPMPAWLYAVIFILASIYGIGRNTGNIGHDAHLGGAIAGIIAAAVINPYSVTSRPILVAAITIPVIIFFVLKDRISFLRR